MTEAPAIILVEPQLSENIGTASRAMMNCALTDLRLVKPKPDWLSERALAASSGADSILHSARTFDSTAAAIADLHHVYATTGRDRTMVKPIVTPRKAAADMRSLAGQGRQTGILFGRERTGLENDDVSLAETIITVPLNPAHFSLNLAQAVLLIGYEWFQAADETAEAQLPMGNTRPARREELNNFFERLEHELELCGFLRNAEMKPHMMRNIRAMFLRTNPTEQEVRTLHGIVTELVTARRHRAIDMFQRGIWRWDERPPREKPGESDENG